MTSKYEESLRATISRRHRSAAEADVPLPDAAGAFPRSLLPWVFPVVLDTHALGTDLARCARSGRTILVSGGISGALRLYCPKHVIGEVDEWMRLWARMAKRPAAEVAELWAREYQPLLRVVDVPSGPLYPDDAKRVRVLATGGHPYGDPDDVPTAHLALLLDAPLLSKDRNLLRAVYGEHHDLAAHREWLEAVRGGGDAGPLGELLWAGYMITAGTVRGTYHLIAKAIQTLGWPITITLAGAGALGLRQFLPEEARTRVVGSAKTALMEAVEMLGCLFTNYGKAREQIEALAPGSIPQREGYDPKAVLRRACLHEVARVRSGHVSAGELSSQLRLPGVPHGEGNVREVLRGEPAFVEVYRGRFQLGRALVRRLEP